MFDLNVNTKVFVAGHRGMVGSSVCRRLQSNGIKNIITASRSELDLSDKQAVFNYISHVSPEVVIIAAAKVGGIMANQKSKSLFLSENLEIQNNLIWASFHNGVRRLVFLGSSCIYPKFATQPLTEESLLTGELEPTNEGYALAKICGIKLCQYLRKEHLFDAFSIMPCNLYGPNDNFDLSSSHVLPAMVRKLYVAKSKNLSNVRFWGSGLPKREFLHVDDLSDSILHCIRHFPRPSSDVMQDQLSQLGYINSGAGTDISIKDLASLIASKIGFKGSIDWDTSKPDGTPRKLLDIHKMSTLGWTPAMSLDTGITETINGIEESTLNSWM